MAKRKRNSKRPAEPESEISIKGFLEWLDQEFQSRQNNPNPPYPYNRKTNAIQLPEEIEKELIAMVKAGEKVEAIKRVTKLTGAGLRVSKDYVDDFLSKI